MNSLKFTLKAAALSFLVIGCESNQLEAPTDCSTLGPSITLVDKTDSNCGEANGSVELAVTGGQGSLVFSSSNLPTNSTGIFTGISAGSYTFLVTDEQACQSELVVTIGNSDGVSVSEVTVTDGSCNTNNGTIKVSAIGGFRPYSYKLNAGSFQADSLFTNLAPGGYALHVKDDAGCEFSQQVEISSGISFSTSIASIISNNCAISGCHNGNQFPDLRSKENIIANANSIKSRTKSKSMPLGRSLTQLQIDQIECWVNDGALDN